MPGSPNSTHASINANGEYQINAINATDDAAVLTMKATLSTGGTQLVSTFEVTKSKQGVAGTALPGSPGPKLKQDIYIFIKLSLIHLVEAIFYPVMVLR